MANEFKDQIDIYKINIEEEFYLTELFNIRSIPSFLFIPMDKDPQMASGAASKEELKRVINELLLKSQSK